jgi:hypothetical protein
LRNERLDKGIMVNRKTAHQSNAYQKNVTKRGQVVKKKKGITVNPWLLALFVFVVIGSAVLQIISTAQSGR